MCAPGLVGYSRTRPVHWLAVFKKELPEVRAHRWTAIFPVGNGDTSFVSGAKTVPLGVEERTVFSLELDSPTSPSPAADASNDLVASSLEVLFKRPTVLVAIVEAFGEYEVRLVSVAVAWADLHHFEIDICEYGGKGLELFVFVGSEETCAARFDTNIEIDSFLARAGCGKEQENQRDQRRTPHFRLSVDLSTG